MGWPKKDVDADLYSLLSAHLARIISELPLS